MAIEVTRVIAESDQIKILKQALRDIYNARYAPDATPAELRRVLGVMRGRVMEAFNELHPDD